MKPVSQIHSSRILIPLVLAMGIAAAAPVALIDYDDGDPANGVHQSSLRNGGCESGKIDDSLIATPSWVARFSSEADDATLTLGDNRPALRVHGNRQQAIIPIQLQSPSQRIP